MPSDAVSWVQDFDILHDAEHDSDPYPRYHALRTTCPVARSERHGGYWIVSRHDHIYRVLQDTESFSSRQIRVGDPTSGMLANTVSGQDGFDYGPPLSVTTMDPPEHTTFKTMLIPLFSPAVVASWEPHVVDACRETIKPLTARRRIEFVREVAEEIPLRIFLLLLGVPERLRSDVAALHRVLREGPRGQTDPGALRDCQLAELDIYRELLERRERELAGGIPARRPFEGAVIDHLLSARVAGRPLDRREQARLCQQLARAGLHTTAAVLANMVWYLSDHPAERDRLVAAPDLIPSAIEELMRWESIVTTGRYVTRDVELAGVQLPAGSMVMLPLGSAGRDEAQYDSPEEVHFERAPVRHLQFGAGRHRCLGLHLARLELRKALEILHLHLPRYRRVEPAPVRSTGLERATTELWLALD
jgi:cytochrome P450